MLVMSWFDKVGTPRCPYQIRPLDAYATHVATFKSVRAAHRSSGVAKSSSSPVVGDSSCIRMDIRAFIFSRFTDCRPDRPAVDRWFRSISYSGGADCFVRRLGDAPTEECPEMKPWPNRCTSHEI